MLWFVAALQPAAAVVFVLDGMLIGAGDAGYLAIAMLVATLAVYLPAALVVVALDAGLLWLWAAIALWMVARPRRHGGALPHRPLAGHRSGPRMTSVRVCEEQQVARCGDESGAERSEVAQRVARQEGTAACRVSRLAVSDESAKERRARGRLCGAASLRTVIA